jgi:hypothetical protein
MDPIYEYFRFDEAMCSITLPTCEYLSNYGEKSLIMEESRLSSIRDTIKQKMRTNFQLTERNLNHSIDGGRLVLKMRTLNSCKTYFGVEVGKKEWKFYCYSPNNKGSNMILMEVDPSEEVAKSGGRRVSLHVEPFMKNLPNEQHRIFVARAGGMHGKTKLSVLYHVETKRDDNGKFCFVDQYRVAGGLTNGDPNRGLPQHLLTQLLRETVEQFQKNGSGRQGECRWDVDHLIFRVDVGVIRDSHEDSKVLKLYVNKVGIAPVASFLIRSQHEIKCLQQLAKETSWYIQTHLYRWPS